MYKGVSAAYSVIVPTYWQLAFTGYWAFGSQVQPYIVASLAVPKWTIIMANIFAVIQISGCYQVAAFQEQVSKNKYGVNPKVLKQFLCFRFIAGRLMHILRKDWHPTEHPC